MRSISKPQERNLAAFSKDMISVESRKIEESGIEFLKVKMDGEEFFQCRRAFSFNGKTYGIIVTMVRADF